MKPLTFTQKRVYRIIREFVAEHHYSPTLREIADLAALSSVSGAFHHVSSLERAGLLTRAKGSGRTIVLIGEP